MRKYYLTLTILLLPFCGNAQNFNMAAQSRMMNMQQQMNLQQQMMFRMLNQSQTKIQIAEKKLEKEERTQEKLQQKLEENKTRLLTQEQELNALTIQSGRDNNASTQKNIHKLEQEIVKSRAKLTALSSQQEASSKNSEEYKKSLEAAELEKEEVLRKQEEEKKRKKEEKESKAQKK